MPFIPAKSINYLFAKLVLPVRIRSFIVNIDVDVSSGFKLKRPGKRSKMNLLHLHEIMEMPGSEVNIKISRLLRLL